MSLISQDEITLLSDNKYKNYVSLIEKALKNFESSTEWADLISSLGKLKKALQTCPKYQFIPKRISVCKRLAQCLHPALPSGVHLKSLEVYTVIFQAIGADNLSRDLFLYANGLFPLLANAALSVKPILLNIYETYFLPLKQSLRPCLSGLLIGILPGLEEGSEFYTRTFNLIRNICYVQSDFFAKNKKDSDGYIAPSSYAADDKYFYTCLWSAIVCQSSIRFPAIQFILSSYELKKKVNNLNSSQMTINSSSEEEDQLYLIGNSIDLMINAICCCLQDSNSLVQRTILDLICLCLPINSRQINKEDKLQLIIVAIHIVLRRDMSLNRRIYSWLIGNVPSLSSTGSTTSSITSTTPISASTASTPSSNSAYTKMDESLNLSLNDSNYFDSYSKGLLIEAIKMMLHKKDGHILYLVNEQMVSLASSSATLTSATLSNQQTSSNINKSLKILKIVSNLVERQEIGQAIIDDILLDLLFYVYKEFNHLNILTNGIGGIHSSNINMKKAPSTNLFNANATSSNQIQQQRKELNELKKAICNFLFQSFQLYFIWDYCANKFEKICAHFTLLRTPSENDVSPGQLCDLYEFILDLLTNSDIYSEIQTEHLPLMLKRIIFTLNSYCARMTNQDLAKSLLLCLKVLQKIVPKIIMPESKQSNKAPNESLVLKDSDKSAKTDTESFSTSSLYKALESIDLTIIDDTEKSIETIVGELMSDMISKIEDDQITSESIATPATLTTTSTLVRPSEIAKCLNNSFEKEQINDKAIENCVYYLKQLTHTFVKSHLFKLEPSEEVCNKMNSETFVDDRLKCSFKSLFSANFDPSETTDSSSTVLVELKPNCWSYLQSFQFLNRFLIKLLFFPREQNTKQNERSNNAGANNTEENMNEEQMNSSLGGDVADLDEFVNTFEDWLKDLLVISCLTSFTSTSSTGRLFEIQSTALNTILELINLSESVNSHFEDATKHIAKVYKNLLNYDLDNSSSKNICLIQTIFNRKQIEFIYNRSQFGRLTAKMLWSHLNTAESSVESYSNTNTCSSDKRAAILFCLLHEILPNNLCEDIIAQNLVLNLNSKVDVCQTHLLELIDSLKRFMRLWHWSRDLNLQDESLESIEEDASIRFVKPKKTFERSLLIILDILSNKQTPFPVVKLIQEWLVSCICDYNDLPRLLDILLVSLLHPNTARVSIQYFLSNVFTGTTIVSTNEEESSNEEQSDFESKIYAISNEGGNVKYHVNNDAPFKQSAASSTTQAPNPTFLLSDQTSTKPLRNTNVELPLSIMNAAATQGINLRINPFAKNASNPSTLNKDNEEGEEDETDNAVRNARLLESYKAIKAQGDAKQHKIKNRMSNPSPNTLSPNHSITNLSKPSESSGESTRPESLPPISVDVAETDSSDNEEDYNDYDNESSNSEENESKSQTTELTLMNHTTSPNQTGNSTHNPEDSPKKANKNENESSSHKKDKMKTKITSQVNSPMFRNKYSLDRTKLERMVDSQNPIDPNYAHILLYVNCNNIQTCLQSNNIFVNSFKSSSYDHVRTQFVLRCIDQLLSKCSKDFLLSITSTNITNKTFSVYNEKLLDLLVRHFKSIHGQNFFTSTTSSSSSFDMNRLNLNNMTYAQVITMILLFYVRSYYPPNSFTLNQLNLEKLIIKSTSSNSLVQLNNSLLSSTSSSSTSSLHSSAHLTNFPTAYEETVCTSAIELYKENSDIQIYALQILSKLVKELTNSIKTKSLLNNLQQIFDILEQCKLQKTLLHCFYSTIFVPNQTTLTQLVVNQDTKQIQHAYVCELMNALENLIELENILNDCQTIFKKSLSSKMSNSSLGANSKGNSASASIDLHIDDDLLLTFNKKAAFAQANLNSKLLSVPKNTSSLLVNWNSLQSTRYISSQSICNQSMFISTILHYLKNMNLVEYHLPILKLVKNSLVSSGTALKTISTYVVEQLCRNLLYITNGGSSGGSSCAILPVVSLMSAVSNAINIPDLLISILKQLSYLLNYCLLNVHSTLSLNAILNELYTLSSIAQSESQMKLYKQFQAENELNQAQARDCIINLLPSIVSSMVQVWQKCNLLLNSHGFNANLKNMSNEMNNTAPSMIHSHHQHQQQFSWILGHPSTIKQTITEMLNPITQSHAVQFMSAIGNVWGERRKKARLNQDHKVIIELVRSLKSFSIPIILQNITEILKQPNQANKDKKKGPLNVWLLQFLHAYLENYANAPRLKSLFNDMISNQELASCLCNFFQESLSSTATTNFSPACYFQLFRILHDSVNNFPLLVDDKKYSKDVQDSTHKLFELCNSIVASSLQQTTWLRKNYSVKLTPSNQTNNNTGLPSSNSFVAVGAGPSVGGAILIQNESNTTNTNTSKSLSSSANNSNSSQNENKFVGTFSDAENELNSNLSDHGVNLNSIESVQDNDTANNLTHSLQALNILAEYLAKTLDIVYKSDEKDRLVVPLLMNLMSNLWPYLKTHLAANKNNFRSASHLLMSLTVYPYTRKTWKKEVFEMLFDNSFFHVDSITLEYLKAIIDNLISNDRTMFKDVLIRVTYQQSGGLFTSKEQESEQKAQLLKRLAFVIYSSEKDQYQKNMPEIQECIAHILKLTQSANLYSTLFLLFRILLLRISSRHLVALWPTILTELITALLQIEQDLSDELELTKSKSSYLDHITTTNNTFGQSNPNTKLQIFLSACKLIDLILTLPSFMTPQFQLYKWSFVNTDDAINLSQKNQFVPYLTKINNLLKLKYPTNKSQTNKVQNGPLIRQRAIQTMADLKPFFEIVTTHSFVHNAHQSISSNDNFLSNLKLFESAVHEDFLEGWF